MSTAPSHDSRVRVWLGRLLLAFGAGLLLAWVAIEIDARGFQAQMARRLDQVTDANADESDTHTARRARHEAATRGVVGRLEIPSVGISVVVLEGTAGRTLRRGVGHIERTAFPGERGNVGIAGHRDTYFGPLRDLSEGDRIQLSTPDGSFEYEVDSILIVSPDRSDLLGRTREPTLTLVTCYPFYWFGPAPERYIVRARRT